MTYLENIADITMELGLSDNSLKINSSAEQESL